MFGFERSKYSGRLRRESLDSEYQRCLPSREEAVSYVVGRLISLERSLTSELDDARRRLEEFRQKEGLAY